MNIQQEISDLEVLRGEYYNESIGFAAIVDAISAEIAKLQEVKYCQVAEQEELEAEVRELQDLKLSYQFDVDQTSQIAEAIAAEIENLKIVNLCLTGK